jgi:exonuclease V
LLSPLLRPLSGDSPHSDKMFSPDRGFNFPLFWDLLHLNEQRPLSRTFLDQSGLASSGFLENYGMPTLSSKVQLRQDGTHSEDSEHFILTLTLENVVQAWWDAVKRLALDTQHTGRGVDDELEIVYRRPGSKNYVNPRVKRHPGRGEVDARAASDDHQAIAAAVQASLMDSGLTAATGDSVVDEGLLKAIENSLRSQDGAPATTFEAIDQAQTNQKDASVNPTNNIEVIGKAQPPFRNSEGDNTAVTRILPEERNSEGDFYQLLLCLPLSFQIAVTQPPMLGDVNGPEPTLAELGIIGTKTFQYDGQLLDRHLQDVLEWWHGQRQARGVEVSDSGRCL